MIGTKEHEAWVREVEAATAEGRAPNRPRPEPHEERRLVRSALP